MRKATNLGETVDITFEAALIEELRNSDVVITAAKERVDEAESNQRATLSLVRDQQLNENSNCSYLGIPNNVASNAANDESRRKRNTLDCPQS